MEEHSHSSLSLPSLLCQESETCLDEETFININKYCVSQDYVEMLLHREISFGYKRQEEEESLEIGNWVKCARLKAITWTLETRTVLGFRFQTAYLSMTYFDRFLSRRTINSEKTWAFRLLSVACLSLAAKMEECKVPALSEFRVEEFNFESKVIQRMELLVLNTLEWRMCSITPAAFIHYFITKFIKERPPNNVVSRTVDIILAIMKDINLMDHRPSIIAAAATLVALDQRLTRNELECKMNAISSCRFLEIEDLYSCYSLMQELDIVKLQIPSPDLSPTHLGRNDVIENSSITCAVSTKRKRLTFSGCDQNCGMPDEKRLR
ncbi:hypothetical protein L1049_026951 [Liquidambar formosana]|uniref:B-like cyclin n=1 Tax=Liquidambar formosana TaxID=63359 RepID=A0AAP0NFQ1_LIQFO